MKRAVLLLPALLSACATASDVESLRAEQRRLQDRVEQLEKTLDEQERRAQRARGPDPDKVYEVPVGTSPALGPADAPVTIIEFGEYQCPFCARVQPTLERIRENFGGKVRIVWKHLPLPFHDRARPAALAAECAGAQGRFWQMHDALFDTGGGLSDGELELAARNAELDMDAFARCMDSQEALAKIQADVVLANNLGVRGTPSFFINGRFLSGAQPYAAFEAKVEEALRERR